MTDAKSIGADLAKEAVRAARTAAMTDDLKLLIEQAAGLCMPADDQEAQRRSFAYGNAHIESDRVTCDS